MAHAIMIDPFKQYLDDNAAPLAGGKLYHYTAGLSSTAPVYHNSNLTSAWTQPIVLDAAGRVPGTVFCPATPAIKWVLFDADDVQVGYTQDNTSNYVPAT